MKRTARAFFVELHVRRMIRRAHRWDVARLREAVGALTRHHRLWARAWSAAHPGRTLPPVLSTLTGKADK